jgi:hypothetical protein
VSTRRRLIVGIIAFAVLSSASTGASAQTTQGAYARLAYHKVPPGRAPEFERVMRDVLRPAFQRQRENGQLVNWMLYRVHLTAGADEYNYVSISYHDTWARTESAGWTDMFRGMAPPAAANAIARLQELGPIVRQALYGRVDAVGRAKPEPFKFAVMDFMKIKEGMIDEYLKVEREDWKPLHQVLTNDGNRVGWVLWDYLIPGGTGSTHDFMTAMLFTDYAKIKAANDAEAFVKAHPGKDLQASVARTRKSRDVVRTEIWEVVESLD